MKQFGYTEDMTMDEMLAYAAKRFREYKRWRSGILHTRWEFCWDTLSVMSKALLNIMAVTACAADIGKYMRMKKRPVRHFAYMPESSRLPWIWSEQGMGFGMAEQYQFV